MYLIYEKYNTWLFGNCIHETQGRDIYMYLKKQRNEISYQIVFFIIKFNFNLLPCRLGIGIISWICNCGWHEYFVTIGIFPVIRLVAWGEMTIAYLDGLAMHGSAYKPISTYWNLRGVRVWYFKMLDYWFFLSMPFFLFIFSCDMYMRNKDSIDS